MAARKDERLSTVLVTGGTDGLGRAAAILLAEEGLRVFAAGRSAERRAALDKLARERQLPLEAVEMDVCNDVSVNHALDEIRTRAGPIDVLINSAGIAIVAVMEEITLDDLHRQFETNFFGTVRVIQRVLPEMRQRRRGRIINISSLNGRISMPLFGPYSGSKFALEAMTDALRVEVYPFGISVVLIEPGYIPTGMVKASMELSSPYATQSAYSPYAVVYHGFRRSWKENTSEERYQPEDCARVILQALREAPPKPRYTVTRSAWMVSLARRLLSDRMLDRRIIRAFSLDRAEAVEPPEPSEAEKPS